MNFRFKWGKVIVSILISIFLSLFLIGRNYVCFGTGICWGAYIWMFGGFIVCFLILYVIISLFQKKK